MNPNTSTLNTVPTGTPTPNSTEKGKKTVRPLAFVPHTASPLLLALNRDNNNLQRANMLILKKPHCVWHTNPRGETSLHLAIKVGNVAIIRQLITIGGSFMMDHPDLFGITPVLLAARKNKELVLKLLFENQALFVHQWQPNGEISESFDRLLLRWARKLCLLKIFEICVGLQSRDVSAGELLTIVDVSNPNMVFLSDQEKWAAITTVKHFHSNKNK